MEVLAYFAANRNYSYVDGIANALDGLTAIEVLNNAVRDFISECIHKQRGGGSEREGKVSCPGFSSEDLRRLAGELRDLEEAISSARGGELVLFLRRLAGAAYSRSLELLAGSQGVSQGEASESGG